MPRNVSKADKTARCIALLVALVRAKRGIQLRPFFEKRGWCWRSAYRDINTLRRAGVPIAQHERGWFRVTHAWVPASVVDLKRDELAALATARRLAPMLRELDVLRGKLASEEQLALDFEYWLDVRPPAIEYGRHARVIDVVRNAIRDRQVLHVNYRDALGKESERLIEPAFVRWEPSLESLYLVAWCRTRCALRTFALHRITSVEPISESFTMAREAADEMNRAFRIWARPTVEHISLRFSRRVAWEVRERRWHASQRMSVTPDGGVRLEIDVAAPEELERLLLGYGADVVVEAPARLEMRIREIHAACLGAKRLGIRRAATNGGRHSRAQIDTR